MQTFKVLSGFHFSLLFLFSQYVLAYEFASQDLKISGDQVSINKDTNWKFSKSKKLEKYESDEIKNDDDPYRHHIFVHKTDSGKIESLVIRKSRAKNGARSSNTALYSDAGLALCHGTHLKGKNTCLAVTPTQCRQIIEIYDSTENDIRKRVSTTDVLGHTEVRYEKESREARDLRLNNLMNMKEESSPQLTRLVNTVKSDFPDLKDAKKLVYKTGPDSFLDWLTGTAYEDCRQYFAIHPVAGQKTEAASSPNPSSPIENRGSK